MQAEKSACYFKHMKKTFLILTTLLLLGATLFAVSPNIIPLSSSLYENLDTLYSLLAMAYPSGARPWSEGEAKEIINRINVNQLSEEELSLYNAIIDELDFYSLKWEKNGFSASGTLSLNPEFYLHTNPETFSTDEYWVVDYVKRTPFLYGSLEFAVNDLFYTFCDVALTDEEYCDDTITFDLDENDWSNDNTGVVWHGESIGSILDTQSRYKAQNSIRMVVSSGPYNKVSSFNISSFGNLSLNFPRRAFVSFGNKGWNLMVGLNEISWGNNKTGNFVLNDHIKQHNMVKLSFYSDIFKYEMAYLNMEKTYTKELGEERYRFFLTHRLEFRPASWISFAVSENIMYSDTLIDPSVFNPAYIFHNIDRREHVNALAHFELNVTPFKGFTIYAQGVMDQFQMPWESDAQANACGISLGLDWQKTIKKGILKTTVEGVYTTPLLYRRDFVDFLVSRRDEGMVLDYIGFPYGPDVALLFAQVEYTKPGIYSVAFSAEGTMKGEMIMFKSHNDPKYDKEDEVNMPNYHGSTPSGDNIIKALTFTLKGEYTLPKFSVFNSSVFCNLSYIIMQHNTAVRPSAKGNDFQLVIGAKIEL